MKCADCKFWREKKDARSSAEASDGVGSCHRRSPQPIPETAGLLLHILDREGTLALPAAEADPGSRPTWEEYVGNPFALMAKWPTTWGHDFCGEFVVAKEPSWV